MYYNERNMPGYGDHETWGTVLNSRDPRYKGAEGDEDETDDDFEDDSWLMDDFSPDDAEWT